MNSDRLGFVHQRPFSLLCPGVDVDVPETSGFGLWHGSGECWESGAEWRELFRGIAADREA